MSRHTTLCSLQLSVVRALAVFSLIRLIICSGVLGGCHVRLQMDRDLRAGSAAVLNRHKKRK